MATPRTVRQINRRRALRLAIRAGSVSRASLARDLEMMRSTSGSLMDQLLDEGSLRPAQADSELPESLGGRPAQYYELNPSFAHFIGVEIGVRRIRLVARDFQGRVRHTDTRALAANGRNPEAVCGEVIVLIRGTLERLGWPEGPTLSLGLTLPGSVDRNGVVILAPLLEWKQVSLTDPFRAAFPDVGRILLENDANAFAMAEMAEGALAGEGHAIALWFDVGVGGAIVADGRLTRGASGFAGEFGHMLWYAGGEPAGPRRVRVEDVLGRDGLIAEIRERTGQDVSLGDVVERLGSPSEELDVRAAVGGWIARCAAFVASLSSAIDPGVVVLGGPMSELLLGDVGAIRREIDACMFPGDASPRVALSRIGPAAPAVGVAVRLRDMLIDAAGDD